MVQFKWKKACLAGMRPGFSPQQGIKPGIVPHSSDPRTGEVEAETSKTSSPVYLHGELEASLDYLTPSLKKTFGFLFCFVFFL